MEGKIIMIINKKGFTLIELIVVVVIVGILAAIATPIMRGNIDKAKRREAQMGAATIRTAELLVKTEHGAYEPFSGGAFGATNLNKYLTAGCLNGKYYNDANYTVDTLFGVIYATGSGDLTAGIRLSNGAPVYCKEGTATPLPDD